MSNTVIIPARGGSRRIPRKNIRLFHGKPIIAYSIELALQAKIGHVVVSTEDAEIADVARYYGADALRRPPELAKDEVGTQEVIRHACDELRLYDGDAVLGLYATCPLITDEDLQFAYSILSLRPAQYIVSVSTNPLADAGGFYFGSAYCFRNVPLYTIKTAIYPLPPERCCDINTEADWQRAEQLYAAMKFKQETQTENRKH